MAYLGFVDCLVEWKNGTIVVKFSVLRLRTHLRSSCQNDCLHLSWILSKTEWAEKRGGEERLFARDDVEAMGL